MTRQHQGWLGLGLAWGLAGCAGLSPTRAVNVPVSDLRSEPHTAARGREHDPLQETQLLYGERVRVLQTTDGWARVQAMEQAEWTHHRRWEGYPGWLPASALAPWNRLRIPTIVVIEPWAEASQNAYLTAPSPWRFAMGTQLRATEMGRHLWKVELFDGTTVWIPYGAARSLQSLAALTPAEKRQAVLAGAARLIGDPYRWGGRSPALPSTPSAPALITGLDCSGVVNLAYRAAGLTVPRDAHEQFVRARAVSAPRAADLVFLSERANPQRIVHVMLYAGDGMLIEAPGTGRRVRRIPVGERLGRPAEAWASGDLVDGQTMTFGSYLP